MIYYHFLYQNFLTYKLFTGKWNKDAYWQQSKQSNTRDFLRYDTSNLLKIIGMFDAYKIMCWIKAYKGEQKVDKNAYGDLEATIFSIRESRD